jgi:hypothetical protein
VSEKAAGMTGTLVTRVRVDQWKCSRNVAFGVENGSGPGGMRGGSTWKYQSSMPMIMPEPGNGVNRIFLNSRRASA